MEIRTLITFHHKSKMAKKSLINSNNNIIADNAGRIMENIDYPYLNLKLHQNLFEKIEDDGVIGKYWLKKLP